MNKKEFLTFFTTTFFLLSITPGFAASIYTDEIPPNLAQWKGWVLHGNEGRLCPTHYNNGEAYQCLWPSRLNLNLQSNKGGFSQEWLVFVKAWVPLPGNFQTWPREVTVDGKPAPVVAKDNTPSVHLTPGTHRVEGFFVWDEMPEMIHVPPESGLISLTINGNPVKFPLIESNGRLWLKKKEESLRQEDRVECRIFRLLNDTIPLQVTNLLRITISGQPREITLAPVLLEKAIPMSIKSSLPTRIGPEGELMIQGRPGRWEVEIVTRFEDPVHKLSSLKEAGEQEVWSFQSQNHLRMVKIEGVSPVDPKQTDVPPEWKRFPTFIMRAGSEMILKEVRRGDPLPAPDQLSLNRTWWLDFDGHGFTIQDHINGTLSRQWYLAMTPPGILGRVSVDSVDQLITSHGKDKKPGVELRKGYLQLVAESRFEASTWTVPAIGWDHDFQSVSGVLNLPPGWRLLTTRGVDVATGTWVERWSLLDLFLVLVISLAVSKLWNKRWGMLALFTVALTYHEPEAPRLVWLNVLAALALLRFLPEGWAKKLVNLWRWGSVIFLLVLTIPFIVQQVRWGVYPQLEPHETGPEPLTPGKTALLGERELMRAPSVSQSVMDSSRAYLPQEGKEEGAYYKKKTTLTQDPNALIQTGPGLPTWRWRTIALTWNGPVAKDQKMYLWLLSPLANLILSFLRVGLLVVLIFHLLPFRPWKMAGNNLTVATALIVFTFLPLIALANQDPGYPPPELLQKLQERLLEKPDCLPHCADSPRMQLAASEDNLRILFQVHTGAETAVPLPGSLNSWIPEEVLLDGQPAQGLMKDQEGLLWTFVPEGVHLVTLFGKTPSEKSFQVPLPLRPRMVEVEAKGWTVQGVDREGHAEASIQLTREEKNVAESQTKLEAKIAPFFHLERVLTLGLHWQVRTTLRRMTLPDTPAMVSIPLLEGESVTTAGIHVENGNALINLGAKEAKIVWTSTLKESPTIHLKAPEVVPWTETWTLDVSPIWHCELSGIDVIHHQDKAGYWMPQWQPWQGEGVTISVSRPQAIPGQILTIEEVRLELTPGERYTKADSTLKIRTSKGGEHRVTLPEGANLMQVKVNDQSQPLKQEGNDVIISLQPGLQNISLEWHQPVPSSLITRAPLITIGPKAVNADMVFNMPPNRWILWVGGPRLGPAVLFWSYMVVIILAAIGLGKITWTPLKTRHWLLLGLGLTQVHPLMAIIIVGWLLALGLRKTKPQTEHRFSFNLSQLFLVLWTVVALVCLYLSVQSGLLGIPDMQISGNGSSNFWLHWTQDRIGSAMPQPWVLSLPLFVFRILMLLWALWLAYALLNWLRWGWHCFSEGGLWKKRVRPSKIHPPSSPPVPSGVKA